MYRLSSIALALVGIVQAYAQSPHGEKFRIDCAACHVSTGWIPVRDSLLFDHNSTRFALEGSHQQVRCAECHKANVFSDTRSQCVDCHTDVHNMSVGNDCARCHSTETWIVDIIPELHEQSGFPLVGAHNTPNCSSCHVSETGLRFNPIGNDCYNCHRAEYQATINPDHRNAGYSTNCIECHDPFSSQWNAELINHDFFPLELGHDDLRCAQCHVSGNYSDASPECVSCHRDDYTITSNPNHQTAGFSTNCSECHSIAGWRPANFDHDGMYFPVYSGKHQGKWTSCAECHTTSGNYSAFSCIACHEHSNQAEVNDKHKEVNGYSYDSNACFSCHPTGDE